MTVVDEQSEAGCVGSRQFVYIKRLLQQLSTIGDDGANPCKPEEISAAVMLVLENRISPLQSGALLTAMHLTGVEAHPSVLAQCAASLRKDAPPIKTDALRSVVESKGSQLARGRYRGGLCDIVGTGGDYHNTFNVSTAASIICSGYLLMAKFGNRSITSNSGSADVLSSPELVQYGSQPAVLTSTNPVTLPEIYTRTNFAFLLAPAFLPSIARVASIRQDLGMRSIFNLLGPLINPVESTGLMEARVIGVARRDLGGPFAQALAQSFDGSSLVVCGEEELDEISCAGTTHCWAVKRRSSINHDHDSLAESSPDASSSDRISYFTLHPSDFGLPTHPLTLVISQGSAPRNSEVLMNLLTNKLPLDDPVRQFVLMNAAALLSVSGVCDDLESPQVGSPPPESSPSSLEETCTGTHCSPVKGIKHLGAPIPDRGPGGFRWKEGFRLASLMLEQGTPYDMWTKFAARTHELNKKTRN